MRILIVLTSQGNLGNGGRRTGFRFDEFAAAYLALLAAGAEVVIASPQGGAPPIDPDSYDQAAPSDAIARFLAEPGARDMLRDTLELAQIDASDFDAVLYPGGKGLLWDLPLHDDSIALLAAMYKAGRPMAFVSEAPAVLCRVCNEVGRPIVTGRNITVISELEAQQQIVPLNGFDAHEELRAAGANLVRAADHASHVICDGLVITGQNPASVAEAVATLLLRIAEGNGP